MVREQSLGFRGLEQGFGCKPAWLGNESSLLVVFRELPFQEASKYLAILRRVTAENAFEIDGVLSVDLGLKLRFVEPAASYKQKMLEIGSTLVL